MGMIVDNLCNSCTNIGCIFQSGIVRTKCAFYMPPHIEPDNCGNYLVQDSTTKNDLASSIVKMISEKVTETHEEFIFETIRPYCENVVQMKISKRDLEQALLKYYGKNDLGADREKELDWLYRLRSEIYVYMPKDWLIPMNNALDVAIKVLEQEPRCKECKWWKDSDGEYRRGCGAESQCPINRREVFEGNGYCFLFEPQGK